MVTGRRIGMGGWDFRMSACVVHWNLCLHVTRKYPCQMVMCACAVAAHDDVLCSEHIAREITRTRAFGSWQTFHNQVMTLPGIPPKSNVNGSCPGAGTPAPDDWCPKHDPLGPDADRRFSARCRRYRPPGDVAASGRAAPCKPCRHRTNRADRDISRPVWFACTPRRCRTGARPFRKRDRCRQDSL